MIDIKLRERKSPRLKDYDYSHPGAYFVTICTKDKQCILGEIVGEGLCPLPKNTLTPIGKEIEKSVQFLIENYKGGSIPKYVIMPNHIHLIVVLEDSGGDGTPPLQNVVRGLKSYTSNKYGEMLWQRSFHDHIIRDAQDYQKIWEYIDTNPLKWELDCFYK